MLVGIILQNEMDGNIEMEVHRYYYVKLCIGLLRDTLNIIWTQAMYHSREC